LSGYSAGTPTVMTVSPATTSNPTGAAAVYGERITGVILRDLAISSHNIGVEILTADQYLIDDCFMSNTDSMHIGNMLGVDAGDSIVTNSHFAADGSTGRCIYYTAGGALRIVNNKFATCSTSIEMFWVDGHTGGPIVMGNSFENQTTYSIYAHGNSSDARIHGLTVVGNWFNGGGSGIIRVADSIDMRNLQVSSNTLVAGGTDRGIRVGALVDGFTISANLFDMNNNAAAVAVEVVSGAQNGLVSANMYDNTTTTVSNAGTNVKVFEDPTTTAGDMLYRSATALARLGIGAANTVMTSSGSVPQWSAALTLGDGSSSAPAYAFANDPDTGMYRGSANVLRFATAGVQCFQLSAAGNALFSQSVTVQGPLFTMSADDPTLTWTDTGGIADGKTVRVRQFELAGSEYFRWDAVNDAGTVTTSIFDIKRTTTTIDYVNIAAGASPGTTIVGITSAGADITGELRTDTFRIDATPTAVSGAGPIAIGSASTINTRIAVNMNGTTYWIPATTTAF